MATHYFVPVLGKRVRVTSLDNCGNVPASGGDSASTAQVATDGFVSVTLSSEVEEGDEILQRKASGALCVNEKVSDSFKRFTLEMEFCGVNPWLLSKMTNAQVYEDFATDPVGFTVPEGEFNQYFSLELWTGLSGQGCSTGGEEASGYLLLPFVKAGVLGDIELTAEDAVTFSVTSSYTQGGNNWGVGPYEVVYDDTGAPMTLPTALDPMDHLLMMDTGLAPPPVSQDAQPIPALTAA